MRKEIIINADRTETRAALLEDRRLVELYVERADDQRIVGNIYKGRVANVLPGMQAAFVDIGREKNAFLYVDDALHAPQVSQHLKNGSHREGKERPGKKGEPPRIADILQEGQEIVVQVTKEPIGTKGARVVTHLTLPGRFLVLMPTAHYVGVSRRIEAEQERNRLRQLARRLCPQGMGLIVRTVAEGKSEEELAQDLHFLLRVWEKIQTRAKKAEAPALLYKDHDLVYRMVRDVFAPDIDKFVIDSEVEYRKILDWLDTLAPNLKNRVTLYRDEQPVFEAYGIEPEMRKALERRVWLDCGGYLVIDRTEALVSIDVNTGKYTGKTNLADTVLKTNLEAASEIARQLRLRDLGGIIIIDFIDMTSQEDRQKVLSRLEEELRRDRTKTHILGFTGLGLVEMTRKKARQELGDLLQRPCPYCHGSGRVLSAETVAAQARRALRKLARSSEAEAILVAVHPSVGALLIGTGGVNLRRLEEETGRVLFIRGDEALHVEEMRVVATGSRAEIEALAIPVRLGQTLEVKVQEPHAANPQDGIARLDGYVLDIAGAGRLVGRTLRVEVTRVFRTYAKARVVEAGGVPTSASGGTGGRAVAGSPGGGHPA